MKKIFNKINNDIYMNPKRYNAISEIIICIYTLAMLKYFYDSTVGIREPICILTIIYVYVTIVEIITLLFSMKIQSVRKLEYLESLVMLISVVPFCIISTNILENIYNCVGSFHAMANMLSLPFLFFGFSMSGVIGLTIRTKKKIAKKSKEEHNSFRRKNGK